jgi:adenine-specific DNA-methyltransferase
MAKKRKESRPSSALLEGDVLKVLNDLPKSQKYSLIISSPPYNIGKDYEKESKLSLEEYTEREVDFR